jgi:hypothetical protein
MSTKVSLTHAVEPTNVEIESAVSLGGAAYPHTLDLRRVAFA